MTESSAQVEELSLEGTGTVLNTEYMCTLTMWVLADVVEVLEVH